MKNIRIFYVKNCQFLVVKFSVYLNRRVFVMDRFGHSLLVYVKKWAFLRRLLHILYSFTLLSSSSPFSRQTTTRYFVYFPKKIYFDVSSKLCPKSQLARNVKVYFLINEKKNYSKCRLLIFFTHHVKR